VQPAGAAGAQHGTHARALRSMIAGCSGLTFRRYVATSEAHKHIAEFFAANP
jgi:hypothetical protein